MSEHVQTCLNLFRFNMILLRFIGFSNMSEHVHTNLSKLVQIQYDTNKSQLVDLKKMSLNTLLRFDTI